MTHDAILKYRNELILPYQNALPGHWRAELSGVWDAMFTVHWSHLWFCYAHPITGIVTPSTELCNAGLASHIVTDTGHHYYRNDDGTFSDAFN